MKLLNFVLRTKRAAAQKYGSLHKSISKDHVMSVIENERVRVSADFSITLEPAVVAVVLICLWR